ncbi:MAG: hypothetical protein WCO33_05345, partial [bacterium]
LKLETVFLKYVYRNIGIITFCVFIVFCFLCLNILSVSRPSTILTAISDFGIYDETKWIFVFMCSFTSIGSYILYRQVLGALKLEKNILLNILGIVICISYIGLSLTPYTLYFFAHAMFALILFGGFGVFLILFSYLKRFEGKYLRISTGIGILELLFLLIGFPYLAVTTHGWGFPTTIILTFMGVWILFTERFLKESSKKQLS